MNSEICTIKNMALLYLFIEKDKPPELQELFRFAEVVEVDEKSAQV